MAVMWLQEGFLYDGPFTHLAKDIGVTGKALAKVTLKIRDPLMITNLTIATLSSWDLRLKPQNGKSSMYVRYNRDFW